MTYCIMIVMAKVSGPEKFRKDMFKAKRKPIEEIWQGDAIPGVTDIVRFAPSACNSQPWKTEYANGIMQVFRYQKPGRAGIMNQEHAAYFNRIDMGIYLCFLDLCLAHEGIPFSHVMLPDSVGAVFTPIASYMLQR